MGEVIGQITALARFPVKSMGGESLDEVPLAWSGLAGDRQWALVKEPAHSRFPWFTGRDHAPLVAWRAAYPPGPVKMTSPIVTGPDGWTGAIDDPALLQRLHRASGQAPRLLRLGRGAYDSLPVSLVGSADHAAVEEAHGAPVDPRRFRINVTLASDLPMRVWTGRRLRFGDGDDAPRIAITAPIERCVMITIDPDTGAREPWLMRTIAQQFANTYGVHANVVQPGLLKVGAAVRLDD